jgi:hypothetical protein
MAESVLHFMEQRILRAFQANSDTANTSFEVLLLLVIPSLNSLYSEVIAAHALCVLFNNPFDGDGTMPLVRHQKVRYLVMNLPAPVAAQPAQHQTTRRPIRRYEPALFAADDAQFAVADGADAVFFAPNVKKSRSLLNSRE